MFFPREKDDELNKLNRITMQYKEETDREIEKFKTKTEAESNKIFDDLNKQVIKTIIFVNGWNEILFNFI